MQQRKLLLVERTPDEALAKRLRSLGFDVWNLSLHPGLLKAAIDWGPEIAIFDLGDVSDVPPAVENVRTALRGKALTLSLSPAQGTGFDVCFADRHDTAKLESVLESFVAALSAKPSGVFDRLTPLN